MSNYNMGCSFSIAVTIRLMMQYDLFILAIQEHTPWNKEMSDIEVASIKWTCEKWGYFVSISKLQVIIVDKQLATCHWDTAIYKDGCIIVSRFEISSNNFVIFSSIYGFRHSPNNQNINDLETRDENSTIQKMRQMQQRIKSIIMKVNRTHELLYIFGD